MIIRDELFGPYEIHWDDTYTVKEPSGTTVDKKGETVQLYKGYGYYSTRAGAVNRICNLLTEKAFDVATLREVNDKYNQIWEDIKHTLHD